MMFFKTNISTKFAALLLLFILIAAFWHLPYLKSFPMFIHAWANADQYAISLGFLNNSFDFFHPETFMLNPSEECAGVNEQASSITAGNLPIVNYFAAILMHVTGNETPFFLRLITMLFGFSGLLGVYKITETITQKKIISVFAVLIFASSPVFIYYHSSLLPSVPALSLCCLGLWKYLSYNRNNNKKTLYTSMLLLVTASLVRLSFVVPLVAVLGTEFLEVFLGFRKNKENQKSNLPPSSKLISWFGITLLSIIPIVAFLLYNNHLRENYGGIFLNKLLPAKSFDEFMGILSLSWETWKLAYFSLPQYIILIGCISWGIFQAVRSKRMSFFFFSKKETIFVGLLLLGSASYVIAFFQQFIHHDYYFLDSLYLPISLIFIYSLKSLPVAKFKNGEYAYALLSLLLFFPLIHAGVQSQVERRQPNKFDPYQNTYANFTESKDFIKNCEIPEEANVLLLNSFAPNLALSIIKKKAFALCDVDHEKVEYALNCKNYDFILIQNVFYVKELHGQNPELIKKIKVIESNGKLALCKAVPANESENDIQQLLQQKRKILTAKQYLYNSGEALEGSNFEPIEGGLFKLNKDVEFSMDNNFNQENLGFSKSHAFEVSISGKYLSGKDVFLTQAFYENDKLVDYQSINILERNDNEASQKEGETIEKTYFLTTPESKNPNAYIKIYLWNPNASEMIFEAIDFKCM